MRLSVVLQAWALIGIGCAQRPIVRSPSGDFEGIYLPELDQNIFLGIPFAEPPLGPLRFASPKPYRSSWSGVKDAAKYGFACYGMGSFSQGLLSDFSEDCLTLNVVVPVMSDHEKLASDFQPFNGSDLGVQSPDICGASFIPKRLNESSAIGLLPVFVWVHGGGFVSGSSADPRYNLSYIVRTSADIGKPMLAVSFNYRLAGFGFLSGGDMPAGSGNQGLLDQRAALQWVHENIASFGGDPDRVTLAGESAGGWSIGYQIVAYGGNNDALYRSVIMQSGSGLGKGLNNNEYYTKKYNQLARLASCGDSDDKLGCLRAYPAEKLWAIFLQTASEFFWDPVVDGKFLPKYPQELMEEGSFARVAMLAGTNMDECTVPTLGPRGTFNTSNQLRDFLMNGLSKDPGYRVISPMLSPEQADQVLDLYPDHPAAGCPYNTGIKYSNGEIGYQYKRGASIVSDWLMQAGRRYTAQLYTNANLRVFSYLFNQTPFFGIEPGISEVEPVGVPHFHDVSYIFGNPDPGVVNWIGPNPSYHSLSRLMSTMWISFVHSQDPNGHGLTEADILASIPYWPPYRRDDAEIIVFEVNKTHIEKDNFRKESLEFWSKTWDSTMILKQGMAGYN